MTDYNTLEDLENMYQSLYPDNTDEKRTSEHEKRAPAFTFGTALGHKQRGNKGDYVNSLNAKFNELFGDQSK